MVGIGSLVSDWGVYVMRTNSACSCMALFAFFVVLSWMLVLSNSVCNQVFYVFESIHDSTLLFSPLKGLYPGKQEL